MNTPIARDPASIASGWRQDLEHQPRARALDVAQGLGITESELLASRVGDIAIRIDPRGGHIIERMPQAGDVMVLTRNPSVVHEKIGRFDNVSITPPHGLVLDRRIDLRLFLRHWHHGYAVTQPLADGAVRHSLQFFDAHGRAVHKIFTVSGTDLVAWQRIVDDHRLPEQLPGIEVEPEPALAADPPDEHVDIRALRGDWQALRDTHDFFDLLRRHGVGRRQALRLVAEDLAVPAPRDCVRSLLETAAARDVSIMCFVGNRGCIQIHTGSVRRIHPIGPWINVLDPDFNLHLRMDAIDAAYVVRKPTDDGIVTSLELFDRDGGLIAQFFGERKPGQAERGDWRALAVSLCEGATA